MKSTKPETKHTDFPLTKMIRISPVQWVGLEQKPPRTANLQLKPSLFNNKKNNNIIQFSQVDKWLLCAEYTEV